MICSQNEITSVLYKAAVGAGLPVGLAQDVAKAGAWLCASGRPGVAISLDALDSDIAAWCSGFDLLAAGVVDVVNLSPPASLELLEAFAHQAGSSYQLDYVVQAYGNGGAAVSCRAESGDPAERVGIDEAPASEIQVDPSDLERALSLAQQTYVPASEASRLSGAGAGLTDND